MAKLMIIDDEPLILNGLRHLIGKEGIFEEIVGAMDAFDALEKMAAFRPDLVITDIQMPEMDGLELIRRAKSHGVRHFAILTGYDRFEYARQALRLHVSEYLLKPVKLDELRQFLNRFRQELEDERMKRGQEGADSDAEDGADAEGRNNAARCLDYIRRHYARDISLVEVADHLGLHPNYLSGLIKKETGRSFIHHLTACRIDKAKEILLRRPLLPLDQVSRCVGYENPRHFYKVFKKHTGMTPGCFRSTGSCQTESGSRGPGHDRVP